MPICGSFAWKHKDPTISFLIICPDLSICSLHSSYTIWATTYFRFMYMRSHMVENVLRTKESDMVNKQNDNGIWWSWTVLVWIQALKKTGWDRAWETVLILMFPDFNICILYSIINHANNHTNNLIVIHTHIFRIYSFIWHIVADS